jgi:hypothetical protein
MVINNVAAQAMSAKRIGRMTHNLNRELAERRDADP